MVIQRLGGASVVRLAIAVIATFSALSARAQPDIATDHELLAAYCLGRGNAASRHFSQLEDLIPTIRQDFEKGLRKFRTYLAARGYYPEVRRSIAAMEGIVLYLERGKSDEATCLARYEVCFNGCYVPGIGMRPETTQACTDKCGDQEPACVAAAKCKDTAKLPF